jgi:hypothetical protein
LPLLRSWKAFLAKPWQESGEFVQIWDEYLRLIKKRVAIGRKITRCPHCGPTDLRIYTPPESRFTDEAKRLDRNRLSADATGAASSLGVLAQRTIRREVEIALDQGTEPTARALQFGNPYIPKFWTAEPEIAQAKCQVAFDTGVKSFTTGLGS